MARIIFAAAVGMSFAAPAVAEPLRTYWTPESTAASTLSVRYGERFYVQRLLPVKLVRLAAPYEQSLPAGAMLYAAYTHDGRVAYCAYKDRSMKKQAATLFIPMLDKRPCFLDRDSDGRFDAAFTVFDKYGSMATPSGDVGKATPLPQPLGYTRADPALAPETMRIAYRLSGSEQPDKATLAVAFDKAGRDRWEDLLGRMPRDGASMQVLNTRVTINSVVAKQASVTVARTPGVVLGGTSGGVLIPTTLPAALR